MATGILTIIQAEFASSADGADPALCAEYARRGTTERRCGLSRRS